MLSRILNGVITGMAVLAGLILLFIAFSISYGITTRAFGLQSPVWTVQFNEYSLLWMTFLGIAWVLSRRKHVAIDIITGRLTPRAKRIQQTSYTVSWGIVLCGRCSASTASSWSMVSFQRGVTDVQAVDVPKSFIVFVIPFGFFHSRHSVLAKSGRKFLPTDDDRRAAPRSNETDTRQKNAKGGN